MTNDIPLTDVVTMLHDHGVPPSMQRVAIMKYMLEHHTHPTVDNVYTSLSTEMPTLSRTTVYNTLRLLAEHKAVQALTIDERNTCYDADMRPHAHFLCRCCGRIYDMEPTDGIRECTVHELDGFQIEDAQLYYRGVCKYCREEKGPKDKIKG